MKKITPLITTVMMIVAAVIMLSLSSCKKDSEVLSAGSSQLSQAQTSTSPDMSDALYLNLHQYLLHVQDKNGLPPKGENTVLFNKRPDAKGRNLAVKAPDGHHVTLGEFTNVAGYARIRCISEGTRVDIHLKGLIPHGIYTVWVVTYQKPGFNGIDDTNITGVGALGSSDGSKNKITASADGSGSLYVTMHGGNLSVFGSVGDCFSSTYQVMLLGAYHLDGMTHGGVPGKASSWVGQFQFLVWGSKLK